MSNYYDNAKKYRGIEYTFVELTRSGAGWAEWEEYYQTLMDEGDVSEWRQEWLAEALNDAKESTEVWAEWHEECNSPEYWRRNA